MTYPTPLLDQLQARRRQEAEANRQVTLAQTLGWLEKYGQAYGIEKAYIVGSLVRPNHFQTNSDVDIAVETIDPEQFFAAIANLSESVERDVDIIQLSECFFADRLRQQGILWTATNLA